MRAFEVYVNGERLSLAGVGDNGVLTASIYYVGATGRNKERLHLDVGGLLIPQEEHFRWQDRDLAVGDEIQIRIVESAKVDAPAKRFRKDPKREIQAQKRYVRAMAKKLGWKIQIAPGRA